MSSSHNNSTAATGSGGGAYNNNNNNAGSATASASANATTTASPHSAAAAAAAAAATVCSDSVASVVRMNQILDDADHSRCAEVNRRALLEEKLESLRALTNEIERDNWKYCDPGGGGNGTSVNSRNRHIPTTAARQWG